MGADPVTFVVAVVIAAAVSLGVFAPDGSRHATAWGIAAFLTAAFASRYFVRLWARRRVGVTRPSHSFNAAQPVA